MRIILYYLVFVVIYIILTTTTAMFFLTWGAKRTVLEKVYVFFIAGPFNVSTSLWYILLNGIIWATAFYLIKNLFERGSTMIKR